MLTGPRDFKGSFYVGEPRIERPTNAWKCDMHEKTPRLPQRLSTKVEQQANFVFRGLKEFDKLPSM